MKRRKVLFASFVVGIEEIEVTLYSKSNGLANSDMKTLIVL